MSNAEKLTEAIEAFVDAMIDYKSSNYEYRRSTDVDRTRDALLTAIEELQRD